MPTDSFVLGDALVITLEHTRPWHGDLPPFARNRHLLGANLPLARDFVERYGKGIALHRSKQHRPSAIQC